MQKHRILSQNILEVRSILPLYLKQAFLILLCVAVYLPATHAQKIEFNRESNEEFIAQMNYVTEGLERESKNEAQILVDSFAALWMSETLVETQKEWIFNSLDAMQNLRLRPWPEQSVYLAALLEVFNTRDPDKNFQVWHESFQPLLNLQNRTKLLEFWDASLQLFQNNTLHYSNVVRWDLQNNDYVLDNTDSIPKIIFRGGDLICYAQDDSTIIYNTHGEVHILDKILYGEHGKITWERVDLPSDTVYANLNQYTINLTYARWEADSVTFYNRYFFNEALLGKLTERIVAEVNEETAHYPRFESYKMIHEIKNLFNGIDYRGGFTMAGARVIGSGTRYDDATIKIYRADSLFITARGSNFSILSDRIVTQNAAVSIYLSGDSIYHPNINMRYLDATREFSLLRDDKGFSRAPFSNTFHKIDMFCQAIYWNIDTYEIDLRMIRSISETAEAFFESHDYFSDVRYMRMQGISQLHPLIMLRNFGREYGFNTFFIAEYAKYIKGDVASVTAQLVSFSQDGFLSYDQETESVTLNEKLFHYITSYAGRRDYDVIRINSLAPINAKLNMNNFDLRLFGVDRIPLSDQKNVVLHPTNKQVVMKKNRDIYFDGRIESGLFDFYGKEFFFNYDQFKIDLLQTDSMSFRVQSFETDSRGAHSLVRVKTVLEGINGELLVDHPRNKSGQLPYPRFPIFNSNNESFVYYDKDDVQKGVYKRDDVYFRLIPFSIDSLDNATTDNIAFDGVFISTGIFPDFYDYLTVQQDYSLGFNTKTPEDGYTIYNGKAVYKGPINMSYEGLRADGELAYLNANIYADQMLMFPDSARAIVNTLNMKAETSPIEYPEVNAINLEMLYLPHQDNMAFANTEEPFDMFGSVAQLNGSISLTPEGLTGKGELEFFGAKMLSDAFDFKMSDFVSENTNLAILTSDGSEVAINANSYKSAVNFADKTTQLSSIENESTLEFAINRFTANGFDVDWDMEAGVFQMNNKLQDELAQLGELTPEEWIQYDFSGHELISTHRSQDELGFYAGKIDYRLDENIIDASGVKIIKVADAAVYPDEGLVKILQRAEIKKLENAFVIANITTQLHKFYNAEINILSRWDYAGSGLYDYVDAAGNTQTINFGSIAVDKAFRTTIARAEIARAEEFTISPQFGFYGNMDLKAENPEFTYGGSAGIFVDCPLYTPNWMRFEAEIKRDSVYIPLAEELKNEANGSIYTSLMLAGDSVHIYPAILDRQIHYSDIPIITATGYLAWDRDLRQYQITTAERHRDPTLPDNIITINPNTCNIEARGDVNLSNDLGQFKMVTFGTVTHNLRENEVNLELVMGIDFFFLNQALAMVESSINNSENTEPLNVNRWNYTSLLQKRTNKERTTTLINEFIEEGEFRRFPEELAHTFFMADLKMKWDQSTQTFYSTNKVGMGNMDRFPMNKYVDGFVELKKQRTGDAFNMVLIPSGIADEGIGVNWFFFNYAGGILQTIASDNEYNNMIRGVKANKRRMDVERGEEPFSFLLSSDRRPFDFMRSMRILNQLDTK
jgi:hypothetical protein